MGFFSSELEIVKDGKLIANRINTDNNESETIDVSDFLLYHLDDVVKLSDGLVLKDLAKLVDKHKDALSPILTKSKDNLHKIIDEMLTRDFKRDTNFKYLELSWTTSIDNFGGDTPDFNRWINFNAIGEPDKNDESFRDYPNEFINWALDFTPSWEISELPIKLNNSIKIFDERKSTISPNILVEANCEFTLLDILYGIFNELSFYGSPDERNEKFLELNESIENIEDSELIEWSEIKNKIGDKLKELLGDE